MRGLRGRYRKTIGSDRYNRSRPFINNQFPEPGVGVSVGPVVGLGPGVPFVGGVADGLVVGVGCVGVGDMPPSVVGVSVGLAAGSVGVADALSVGVALASAVGVFAGLLFAPLLFAPLKFALMATPLPSVVTTIGSGIFSKATQFRPLGP